MKKLGSLLIISFLAILCSCSDEPTYVDGNISQSSLNKNLYDKKFGKVPYYFKEKNDEEAIKYVKDKRDYLSGLVGIGLYEYIYRLEIDSKEKIYTIEPLIGYFDISANGAKVVIADVTKKMRDRPSHLECLEYCANVKFKEGWKHDRKVGDPDNKFLYGDFIKVTEEAHLYGTLEIYKTEQSPVLQCWSFTIPPNVTPHFRAFEWTIVTNEPYFNPNHELYYINTVFTLKLLQLPKGNPAE